MGTMHLAVLDAVTKKSGSSELTLVIIVIFVGLFYVLFMRPQRARQRRSMQTQSLVAPGTRVRTTSGMYGTVVSGDDRDVVVEIADGVHVTMLRRAIMEVVPEDIPEPAADDLGEDTHADGEPDGAAETGFSEDTPPDDWDIKDKNT